MISFVTSREHGLLILRYQTASVTCLPQANRQETSTKAISGLFPWSCAPQILKINII